jgi:nucleotide-binding universal stress UspA family protein
MDAALIGVVAAHTSSSRRGSGADPERAPAYGILFKTLLVPVDLDHPEMAELAIELAIALAHASNGTVRLIHVQSTLPFSAMGLALPLANEAQAEAERRLEALAAGVSLPNGSISSTVRIGSVCNEVLDEAEKIGADLIIVGSHAPNMATYLLGSNASTIVRHSKCSVLVVR